MGADSSHRRLSVPPGSISHPGTPSPMRPAISHDLNSPVTCCTFATYNCSLFFFVFYATQRLKVDLDRSTAVNQFLGARVARCTLTGLANFLYR